MEHYKTIYRGKVDIDRLILFHQKEAVMAGFKEDNDRANFHTKAARLLKDVKEVVMGNC